MSTIIETDVTNYLLLKDGVDSVKEFEARILERIEENKEEDSNGTTA